MTNTDTWSQTCFQDESSQFATTECFETDVWIDSSRDESTAKFSESDAQFLESRTFTGTSSFLASSCVSETESFSALVPTDVFSIALISPTTSHVPISLSVPASTTVAFWPSSDLILTVDSSAQIPAQTVSEAPFSSVTESTTSTLISSFLSGKTTTFVDPGIRETETRTLFVSSLDGGEAKAEGAEPSQIPWIVVNVVLVLVFSVIFAFMLYKENRRRELNDKREGMAEKKKLVQKKFPSPK
jgi:hypothetical protein